MKVSTTPGIGLVALAGIHTASMPSVNQPPAPANSIATAPITASALPAQGRIACPPCPPFNRAPGAWPCKFSFPRNDLPPAPLSAQTSTWQKNLAYDAAYSGNRTAPQL